MRRSGVLLPISSLSSQYGIGAFSKSAYEFIDFLKKAGQSYWQILPLGPTGYGDSPYQSFSTFAGNPYYIDLEELVKVGYLKEEDCLEYDFGDDPYSIDYEKVYLSRFRILRRAYEKSNIEADKRFQEFISNNSDWLLDYALYMAVKNAYSGKSFTEWDQEIKERKPEAMAAYRIKYKAEIGFYQFQQFLFHEQWNKLKKYANKRGIEIIGDIPIYVAFDSADTWANPELFQFDKTLTPIAVAGCPPDSFSATGQLWGNPLYQWEYHGQTGYEWWIRRIAHCYKLYDVVRIDHFRGFDEYYAIPYGNKTAEKGSWKKGPGIELFKAMKEKLGDKSVIAEDLGFLTPSVLELVEESGFPGMKVLQFAFDSREESDYLPHNYCRNSVVYTGTHDNDTILGWYEKLDKKDRKFADFYMDLQAGEKHSAWKFIRAALASVSDTAVIPLQDYLELGSEARINIPSTVGTNWKWRVDSGLLTEELAEKIKKHTKTYGRIQC